MEFNHQNFPNISFKSPEWVRLCDWYSQELLETYQRLAGLTTGPEETQQLRGKASFLTRMLNFERDSAAFQQPK